MREEGELESGSVSELRRKQYNELQKHSDENEKFYKRLCERFLEHVESLETVSRAEIAMLQRLAGIYIQKAFNV